MSDGLRTCSLCGDTKPTGDFYLRAGRRLSGKCKDCERRVNSEYRRSERGARLDRARQARKYYANPAPERERQRIRQAVLRELARRHADEFYALLREASESGAA